MEPKKRIHVFVTLAKATAFLQEKGVTPAIEQELVDAAMKATKACQSKDLTLGLAEVLSGLSQDRHWEPKEDPPDSDAGHQFMEDSFCKHSAEWFINMALALWGDRTAQSLTWKMLCNAAAYHFKMDLRNAVRPVLDRVGALPKRAEDEF